MALRQQFQRLFDASTDSDIPKNVPFTCVCFITAGPITKLFAGGEEESGGHVL